MITRKEESAERDHSACGVGLMIDFPQRDSHQIVSDALKVLGDFNYRSGYNPVTEENDGAGIKFHGLPTAFFNSKIQAGEFIVPIKEEKLKNLILHSGEYAIGQYFLPNETTQLNEAKSLIESCLAGQKLKVVGWRDLAASCDNKILSEMALKKKPAIWQALIVPTQPPSNQNEFEKQTLEAANKIYARVRLEKKAINIVSQSTESIIYKGMILPKQLGNFYLDLKDSLFTAYAALLHTRFATNTYPEWHRAQPCTHFLCHNGEFNSASANATQMINEMKAVGFEGIFPNSGLSDSMQFDADLANQIVMKDISLMEALVRLMPPTTDDSYSDEIKAMLNYFKLERTPYDGPAFAVVGWQGVFIAKLDSVGLRPSRWAITEDSKKNRRFIAGSNDFVTAPASGRIIKKGHLDPGGMLMVTAKGEIVETLKILERINAECNKKTTNRFQSYLAKTLSQLSNLAQSSDHYVNNTNISDLNRLLYSMGIDHEDENTLRFMAENGVEPTAAMGDDTNPLHINSLLVLISNLFHQLFAQVSSPSIDSIRESERFSLITFLGMIPRSFNNAKQIQISSPILDRTSLEQLTSHPTVESYQLELSFEKLQTSDMPEDFALVLRKEIIRLSNEAESFATKPQGGILILSNKKSGPNRWYVPDLIAVGAVRKHLENKNLSSKVSIVVDSNQALSPHQALALLTVGASAIFPRAGYAKIIQLYQEHEIAERYQLYRKALEKCLLKTMGKIGILDVNNYIGGHFMAALGINLTDDNNMIDYPTLGNIFPGFYSPLKGISLNHVMRNILLRHDAAYDANNDFSLLPRSGVYMPEKDGIKHGYGPEVINAFTDWMKAEDLRMVLHQLNLILIAKGFNDFVSDPTIFSVEKGFLDPRKKDAKGYYPSEYLEKFSTSDAFKKMLAIIYAYKKKHPTSLGDYFDIKRPNEPAKIITIQSKQEIRKKLFSGSMSQGALTVANELAPNKQGAHETLTRGMNAIGANSASGEGGEAPEDLINPIASTTSKQIASGRFGVSALQILCAEEIEIKIVQGAKPGEGGELSGLKVSIRFAAQRGGLPGMNFISPPPHHDIYSIEDIEQLIHDIKSINPNVKVGVKLVASVGVETIAVGVAKAGADVINIASHSGGTGASPQSSIKHAGLPSELGLYSVHKALLKVGLRDLVTLRVSGGCKTPRDVILYAIWGADEFEFGSSAMITLGCKMQRTCNHSCQPGVATDGHLFKGDQLHVERYFLNITAGIEDELKSLGMPDLRSLRGHTDLLEILDPTILELYDFTPLLDQPVFVLPMTPEKLNKAHEYQQLKLKRDPEDTLLKTFQESFSNNPNAVIESNVCLTTENRSFPGRIIGGVTRHLRNNPNAGVTLRTTGNAGQSYGCFMTKGMSLIHRGTVQDGCGKSMTGGELIIITPNVSEDYKAEENTLVGNAMLYGASGGKTYVNGIAGHRFSILLKGEAEVVVEGTGDFPFEYMTSGSGMILGKHGKGLGTGASAGTIFVYDPDGTSKPSNDLRLLSSQDALFYQDAIKKMLKAHLDKTNSAKAKYIYEDIDNKITNFKIYIPKELDKINTLQQVIDIIKTFQLRKEPLAAGMQVWLEQKLLNLVTKGKGINSSEKKELRQLLPPHQPAIFSDAVNQLVTGLVDMKELPDLEKLTPNMTTPNISSIQYDNTDQSFFPKKIQPITNRLKDLHGEPDYLLANALQSIHSYVLQLSKNAQGCSGCRAQSCAGGEEVKTGCPSGKPVNTINAILKRIGEIKGPLTRHQWSALREAFEAQIKESPFIAYTGAACPAPCQDACTETIPNLGASNPKRAGKSFGEPVHIKDIEYYLYHVGRALGWFNGKLTLSDEQMIRIFGGSSSNESRTNKKRHYDIVMTSFQPPFKLQHVSKKINKELIIIGSGPAGMQIAFQALQDGIKVRMYEKSDRPGGLLVDGIPHHKFDKNYITEDFNHLKDMGLELHLNSEILYDPQTAEYVLNGKPITDKNNVNQFLVHCTGAGLPKNLPDKVVDQLSYADKNKIVQAVDFLKAANDVASELKNNPNLTPEQKNSLIVQRLGNMDPRNKKIVVIGGGDTAQDAIRWITRYFNYTQNIQNKNLQILVRGPQTANQRKIEDKYPSPSVALTEENLLRNEEVKFVNGNVNYLVEIEEVVADPKTGKLTLTVAKKAFKHASIIQSNQKAQELFESLPRGMRPLEDKSEIVIFEEVDMVICALGFERRTIPHNLDRNRVSIAGDAAGEELAIIVGAQESAKNTYEQIRSAMGIPDNKPKVNENKNASTFFKVTSMKNSSSTPEFNGNYIMKSSSSAPNFMFSSDK